jgi:hypothetical protein
MLRQCAAFALMTFIGLSGGFPAWENCHRIRNGKYRAAVGSECHLPERRFRKPEHLVRFIGQLRRLPGFGSGMVELDQPGLQQPRNPVYHPSRGSRGICGSHPELQKRSSAQRDRAAVRRLPDVARLAVDFDPRRVQFSGVVRLSGECPDLATRNPRQQRRVHWRRLRDVRKRDRVAGNS